MIASCNRRLGSHSYPVDIWILISKSVMALIEHDIALPKPLNRSPFPHVAREKGDDRTDSAGYVHNAIPELDGQK
jgi:hypothetical protein